MGLFKKLKQGLGMGTVKVTVTAAPQVGARAGSVDGTMTITAESDQRILSISAVFERVLEYTKYSEYTDSDGGSHSTWSNESHRVNLGKWEDTAGFAMTEGEVKEFSFSLAFEPMDEVYEMGLASRLWTFIPSNWMAGREWMPSGITYVVRATVDVDDAAFDKEDEQIVQVT